MRSVTVTVVRVAATIFLSGVVTAAADTVYSSDESSIESLMFVVDASVEYGDDNPITI